MEILEKIPGASLFMLDRILLVPLYNQQYRAWYNGTPLGRGGRSFSEEAETDNFGTESPIAAITATVRLAHKVSDLVILILHKP